MEDIDNLDPDKKIVSSSEVLLIITNLTKFFQRKIKFNAFFERLRGGIISIPFALILMASGMSIFLGTVLAPIVSTVLCFIFDEAIENTRKWLFQRKLNKILEKEKQNESGTRFGNSSTINPGNSSTSEATSRTKELDEEKTKEKD